MKTGTGSAMSYDFGQLQTQNIAVPIPVFIYALPGGLAVFGEDRLKII